MTWAKICIICRKDFISKHFAGICCSTKCTDQKKQEWDSKHESNYVKLRFDILKRDNFTCQYCGRNPQDDGIKLQIDHIHPKSKGGEYEINNLITACNDCNIGKLDHLLHKHNKKRLKKQVNKTIKKHKIKSKQKPKIQLRTKIKEAPKYLTSEERIKQIIERKKVMRDYLNEIWRTKL